MRPAVIAVVVLATAAASPRPASAGPGEDLDHARQAFRAKDCATVIKVAAPLIYPRSQLASTYDLIEARILLGVCYYENTQREDARREFEAVLALQPDKSLDTLLFSADAVRFFTDVKSDADLRAQRDAELRRREDETERRAEALRNAVVFEKRSYGVNFVPFGAGQFQNRQTGKGLAFAATEVLTGGASAVIFGYLAAKYGFVGVVSLADGPSVRRLQQIEVGTGVAFLGIYALGVVDALVHYKPTSRIQADESLAPELMKARGHAPAPRPRTSLLDRIHVLPIFVPAGAGVGLSLEDF